MIRPLGKRVLIERSTPEETKGGLILVESAQEKKNEGVVISYGAGVTVVQAGDKVLYSRFKETAVTYEDKEFLIINEEDLIGVVG